MLLEGTPRRRARPRRTTFARLASIRPFLAETAFHYSTLRQVTPDDVTGWLDGRKHQANDASALRDLFRTLKSKRLVFTNPTDGVRVVKRTRPHPTGSMDEFIRGPGGVVAHVRRALDRRRSAPVAGDRGGRGPSGDRPPTAVGTGPGTGAGGGPR